MAGCVASAARAETTVSAVRRSGPARGYCLLSGRQRLAEQCEFSFLSASAVSSHDVHRELPSPVTGHTSDAHAYIWRASARKSVPRMAAEASSICRPVSTPRASGRLRHHIVAVGAASLFFSSVASSSCCAALISAVTSTFGRSAEEAIVGALLEICGAASSLSSGSSLASPARRLVRAGSSRRGCEMPLAGRICFSSFLARLGFSGCQFLFEAVAEVLPFRVGLFDNCARRPANLFLLGVQWGRRDVVAWRIAS